MDNKLIQRKILKLLYELRLDHNQNAALSNIIIEKLGITVNEFRFNIDYLMEKGFVDPQNFFDGYVHDTYYVITAEGIDLIDNIKFKNVSNTKLPAEISKRKNGYVCVNCDSPIPPSFAEKEKFNNCPVCGHLYPQTVIYIENYFRMIQLSKSLEKAKRLFLKSEIEAAVREAIIQYETCVKNKSGLDLSGADLMAKAFKFEINRNDNIIIEEPKIKLNDLSNNSMRNEQEGVQFLSMGLMKGVRNIYMHSEASEKLYHGLQIISMVDFLLTCIEGYNIT